MKKTLLVVIIFLVIGSYMIIRNSNLDIEESEDRKTFLGSFKDWVFGLGKNIKDVSSYAVKEHDWMPTNETGDINESEEA